MEHFTSKCAGWVARTVILFVSLKAMAADYQSTIDALTRGLPIDVSEFIVRRVDCNHWAGEEPYDDERAKDIRDAMAKLGCQTIGQDDSALRRVYAGNAKVLKALDDAQKLSF
jgi:hypothetical protein